MSPYFKNNVCIKLIITFFVALFFDANNFNNISKFVLLFGLKIVLTNSILWTLL